MNTTINANKKPTEESEKKKEAAKWTLEQEELLAEWAEKAACYRWLHNKSEKQYRCRNYAFTIPVIILSTLTGTANFAMDSFVPEERKKMAMGIVGGVNIFAGILSTLQNFLRYAELMEGHRSSGVSWSKFSRNITVELALDEKRRKPAGDFLKICRAEFDRLIEQAPGIDDKIIKQFDYHFKENDIIRPEVCNGLRKCKIYKPSEEEKLTNILTNVGDKLLNKKDSIRFNKKKRLSVVSKPTDKIVRPEPKVPKRDIVLDIDPPPAPRHSVIPPPINSSVPEPLPVTESEPVAESIQLPIHEPMSESAPASEPATESEPSVFTPSEEDFVNGIDNSNP